MSFESQTDEIKKEIRSYIGDGNITRAISSLEARLDQKSHIYNDFLLVKSRYSLIEIQNNKGIVKGDEYSVEVNKISGSLLNLINDVEIKFFNEGLSLNIDYLEDWGIIDYYDEYQIAKKEFSSCQERIKAIQDECSKSLSNNSSNMKKTRKSKTNNRQIISSLTSEGARAIKKFSIELEEAVKAFDISLNKTVYFSLKIMEFQLISGNKSISLSQFKNLNKNNKRIKESLKSLKAKLIDYNKVLLNRPRISRDHTLAMKSLVKAYKKFAEKCDNSIKLIDTQMESFSVVLTEHLYHESFFSKVLKTLGLDYVFRRLIFKK